MLFANDVELGVYVVQQSGDRHRTDEAADRCKPDYVAEHYCHAVKHLTTDIN